MINETQTQGIQVTLFEFSNNQVHGIRFYKSQNENMFNHMIELFSVSV